MCMSNRVDVCSTSNSTVASDATLLFKAGKVSYSIPMIPLLNSEADIISLARIVLRDRRGRHAT